MKFTLLKTIFPCKIMIAVIKATRKTMKHEIFESKSYIMENQTATTNGIDQLAGPAEILNCSNYEENGRRIAMERKFGNGYR